MLRTSLLTLAVLLLTATCALATDNDYSVVSQELMVAMPDGVQLDTTWWRPDASGNFPLVMGVHGWGGHKHQLDDVGWNLANKGYICVAYTSRGLFDSEGMAQYGRIEVDDLIDMITWSISNLPVNTSKIAVSGGSHGGGVVMMATARDHRITNCVAMCAYHDLACMTAYWDQSYRWLLVNGMYYSAVINGTVDPVWGDKLKDEADCGWECMDLNDWHSRSPINYNNQLTQPIYFLHGTEDPVVFLDECVANYNSVATPAANKKIQWWPGGHDPAGFDDWPSDSWNHILRWLDYWFYGEQNGIMQEDPFGGWPRSGSWTQKYYLRDGVLNPSKPGSWGLGDWYFRTNQSSVIYYYTPPEFWLGLYELEWMEPYTVNDVPSNEEIVFSTSTLGSPLTIAGQATLKQYWNTTEGHELQLCPWLYDVNPSTGIETKITKGMKTRRDLPNYSSGNWTVNLVSRPYTVPAGHQLKLQVATNDWQEVRPLPNIFWLYLKTDCRWYPSALSFPRL